jgi:hypothetical protein
VKPYVHIEKDDDASEPVSGLPAALPQGERILWQGAPAWSSLAIHAFHARKIAIYFGLLMLWRFFSHLAESGDLLAAARYGVWIWPLALAGVTIVILLAYAYARTTLYTVTTRRVVIRSGVALSVTVNLPFKRIDGAGVHLFKDGTGDMPIKANPEDRVPLMALWPNQRPWRWLRPEPMLRSVPDAARVAEILGSALTGAVQPPAKAEAAAGSDISVAAGGLKHAH